MSGNRAGFQLLRDSLERLLASNEETLQISSRGMGIGFLSLTDAPEEIPTPPSLKDQVLSTLFGGFLLSILLFALYGFIHFIESFLK